MRWLLFFGAFAAAFSPVLGALTVLDRPLVKRQTRRPVLRSRIAPLPSKPEPAVARERPAGSLALGASYEAVAMGDGCFQLPVGPPNGHGYYVYRGFRTRHHLGEDWNGVGGGATDLGDPVYASADGVVTVAEDFGGGWGLVVRVVHRFEEEDGVDVVETVFAHLDEMYVEPGDYLLRGDLLGTIGDAHGVYVPHLHFELRTDPGMRLGGGYDRLGIGYTDPRAFVRQHGCRG